ncbi:MAG: carboxypeptidase-like regulatory domain-containing protein [Acidobacteria bacterium]|nr:carboxypeptidase-like regulatory domain-containing protein [Acidobacteriota bacterium]
MRRITTKLWLVVLLGLAAAPALVQAQTAGTATVTGTVTDATGAAVPGAKVELREAVTNTTRSQTTNNAGGFIITSVPPGVYKVTASREGFNQAVFPSVKVEVGKSVNLNIQLKVGDLATTIEVVATTQVELQTMGASVGNVLGGDMLSKMPALSRDATALLSLQPMVTQGRSEGEGTGGQVAGARSDQNTFMLDGGDATSNTEGNGGYNSGFSGTPRAAIPTPIESIEEFRVGTNNPDATFGRSMGGQVQMVTRRGTNDWHGAGYWYHQNDNLNANTWNRNRLGQKDPELKDNRFGGRVGGPIWKDRAFFFFHYEGRRFPQSGDVFRVVPTAAMKAGILQFRDAAGNIVSYPLATSTQCGPAGGSTCDPRGLGISPVVQAVWNLLPDGNDPNSGDGLNTIGFRAPAAFTLTENFIASRFDYRLNDKWNLYATYRWGKTGNSGLQQIDISGLRCGAKGTPCPTRQNPLAPRYLTVTAIGQITPNLTTTVNFNWLRHWWEWATVKPFPQVTGTAAALAIAGEAPGSNAGVDEPINIDTQSARGRIWLGHDYVFSNNTTWIKGHHTVQFGGRATHQLFFHQRDDKVVGSLTSPVYQVTKGTNVLIPTTAQPIPCSSSVTTGCLPASQLSRWNTLYASVLGIVDRGSVLVTRDGQLNANPIGTPLKENVRVNAYEGFINDTWRIRPSITLSYGLTWNVQLPPIEEEGKQTLMVDSTSNAILDSRSFLENRRQAALAGNVYNPTVGFLPIRKTGRKYPYDADWNNFGPRVAAAWSPSYTDGFLGKMFGSGKTVLRAGYGITYDRINGVGIVMVPILGVGFGQTFTCRGPSRITGGCTGSGGTDPTTAFRIGVDGSTVPLPTVGPITALPIIPGVNSVSELLSFQIDTKRRVGASHGWDVTLQRELPFNMLLEVGYVGRRSTHLYQGVDLNSVPFFMKGPGTNQTFAQAFDATAAAVRAGSAVTPQAWFENSLAGSTYCQAPFTSCTEGVAASFGGELTFGSVFDMWTGLEPDMVFGPTLADSQVLLLYMISDFGRSNYNAGFVTVRKRTSKGLTFDMNYTWSHTTDQIGINQNSLNSASNPWDLNYDYGPALFDRRHTFNTLAVYDLPFGKGRRFSAGNALDRVIGGWTVAGIYTYSGGLPMTLYQGVCQEYGAGIFGNCAGALPSGAFKQGGRSVHRGVTGSGGIGTAGNQNLFSDPAATYNAFRRINVATDTRQGNGVLRGLPRWNFDMSITKTTRITEKVGLRFSAEMTNLFNHPEFNDPSTDLTDPTSFGVLNSQYNRPRFIQLGFRIDF